MGDKMKSLSLLSLEIVKESKLFGMSRSGWQGPPSEFVMQYSVEGAKVSVRKK